MVKPAEILALELAREKLVLIDGAVLDLVHLVQLSLELDKLLAALRLSVDNTLLVLLQGVHHLQEVTLLEEELEVFGVALICLHSSEHKLDPLVLTRLTLLLTSDGLDRHEKSVLIEVLFETGGSVFLDPR